MQKNQQLYQEMIDQNKNGYGKFSHNLADKFHDLLKKDFAYIDFVGCKIR